MKLLQSYNWKSFIEKTSTSENTIVRLLKYREKILYHKGWNVRSVMVEWVHSSIELRIFNSIYVFKEEMLLLGSDFKYSL